MPEITWTPTQMNVADLKELPGNPRKISPESLAKLKDRIANRGFHDVVKVDTEGFILSGNQRKKALTELGMTSVWALVPSRPLSREERDRVVLESNRNDGEWDFQILKENFDIEAIHDVGFNDKELGIVSFQTKPKEPDFTVVVDCATEEEQIHTIKELNEKGYKAHVA